MNIVLSFTEIKELIANKYLCRENFITKKSYKSGSNVKLRKEVNNILSVEENISIVFLSQIEAIAVTNSKHKSILESHFDVPLGLLKLIGRKIPYGDEYEYRIDKSFLLLRSSLISSFLKLFEDDFNELEGWHSFISNFSQSDIFRLIVNSIANKNALPQVQMSSKFAKATKEELEFIWFGQSLGKVYFSENKDRLDDEHKNWLHKLNPKPKEDFVIASVPDKFEGDKEFILSYLIYIKLNSKKISLGVEVIKGYINEIIKDKNVCKNTVCYWILLFDGLSSNYNSYFATASSTDLLLSFETITYNFINKAKIQVAGYDIDKLKRFKEIDKKTRTAYFKSYAECSVENSDLLRNITSYEKDLVPQIYNAVQELQKINLGQKKGLIFISEYTQLVIDDELKILFYLREIEKVLIIFKVNQTVEPDNSIAIEIWKNKIIKNLENKYKNVQFRILLKDVLDKDDREIKNNIKAFVNQFDEFSKIAFISDAYEEVQLTRENNWLINAMSEVPIYDENQNYIFVCK